MHRAAGTDVLFLSWRYRFLNFTHVVPRVRWGCSAAGSTFSFSPSLVSRRLFHPGGRALFHSLARSTFSSLHRVVLSPAEEPPSIVLPSETSFCFTLSLSLSVSRSLSLRTAYYMRFLAFVFAFTADCVRTGELRT